MNYACSYQLTMIHSEQGKRASVHPDKVRHWYVCVDLGTLAVLIESQILLLQLTPFYFSLVTFYSYKYFVFAPKRTSPVGPRTGIHRLIPLVPPTRARFFQHVDPLQ
jgi:hypothetical protein